MGGRVNAKLHSLLGTEIVVSWIYLETEAREIVRIVGRTSSSVHKLKIDNCISGDLCVNLVVCRKSPIVCEHIRKVIFEMLGVENLNSRLYGSVSQYPRIHNISGSSCNASSHAPYRAVRRLSCSEDFFEQILTGPIRVCVLNLSED